jgi:hypothetical protein
MVKFNMLLVEILTVLFLMSLLALEASCRVLPEEKQNLLAGSLQAEFSLHIPLPQSKSWIPRVSSRSLQLSSLDYPKSSIGVKLTLT